MKAISEMKGETDLNYFDGEFVKVHQFVKIFAFTDTLPANKALQGDLYLEMKSSQTNEILKPCSERLVHIDVEGECE